MLYLCLQEQYFLTLSNYAFTFIFGLEMFVKVSTIMSTHVPLNIIFVNVDFDKLTT